MNSHELFDYIRLNGQDGQYNNLPSKWIIMEGKKVHAVYEPYVYILGGEPGNWMEDIQEEKVLYSEDIDV